MDLASSGVRTFFSGGEMSLYVKGKIIRGDQRGGSQTNVDKHKNYYFSSSTLTTDFKICLFVSHFDSSV